MENRPRPSFFLPLIIVFVVIVALVQSISYYVDSLWFGSLGYSGVFWYGLRFQSFLFIGVAALTATILWALFRIMLRGLGSPGRTLMSVQGETININPIQFIKPIAPGFAVLLGLLVGIVFAADWTTFAMF